MLPALSLPCNELKNLLHGFANNYAVLISNCQICMFKTIRLVLSTKIFLKLEFILPRMVQIICIMLMRANS